jgi:hypothetical protein
LELDGKILLLDYRPTTNSVNFFIPIFYFFILRKAVEDGSVAVGEFSVIGNWIICPPLVDHCVLTWNFTYMLTSTWITLTSCVVQICLISYGHAAELLR